MIELPFLALLFIFSGFFAGSEVALLSIPRQTVRKVKKQRKRGYKSLVKLKKRQNNMIITILIGNNIVNILASVLATSMTIRLFGDTALGVATGILTFLMLVFGEIIPKTIAKTYTEYFALRSAPVIYFLSYFFAPVIWLLEKISGAILSLTGKGVGLDKVTEDEIKALLEIGVEDKAIEAREMELMENILNFNDITAKEVMEPIDQVFSLPATLSVNESLAPVNRYNYSRVPVYLRRKENIVGVVHIRTIMRNFGRNGKKKLSDLAISPVKVKADDRISHVFRELKKRRQHLALVLEESRIIGIVTLEELMEEIVGEIMDEKDVAPDQIVGLDKKTIIAHTGTPIPDINAFFNISLPYSKKTKTLRDLLDRRLGKIHRVNDVVTVGTVKIRVDEVEKKKAVRATLSR